MRAASSSPPPRRGHPPRAATRVTILAAIVLLGAALRLWRIGHESLWLDEAFSVTLAKSDVPYILEETSLDVHPPLYYFILYYWFAALRLVQWFGRMETEARLFSVLCSVGVIVAAYAVGRRLFDDLTGLAAAGVLAVSRFQVEFAQEARMYALLALTATAATLCLLRWAESERPAASRRGWIAAYWLCCVVLVYTQVHGWFVIAAHGVTVTLHAWRSRAARVAERWVFVQLLVAAAFLPWFETFAAQVLLVQRGFWIPEPTGVLLPWTVSTYAGSPALAALVIPIAGWGLWRSRGAAQPGTGLAPIDVIVPWLTVPILLPMLLSIVGSPIVLPKYTIAASIPLALCTGRGIAALPRRWMQGATGLAIAALAASALTEFYAARRKDGWRDAVWNLEAAARPGDAVIFYPFFNELPFDVYSRRSDLTRLPAPRHAQLLTGPTLGRLVAHLARPHDRVWLVVLQLDPRKPLLVEELQRICASVTRIREWHIDIYFCERTR